MPFIYGGESEIKRTSGTYKSKKIFGYSIFGNLGIDYGTWEVLLGYRINEFEHHDYENIAGKFNISGNHWTLGLGRGFWMAKKLFFFILLLTLFIFSCMDYDANYIIQEMLDAI